MRVTRNLDLYRDAVDIAMMLEQQAQFIRQNATAAPLIKCELKIWHWNPEWSNKLKTKRCPEGR